MVDLFSSPKLRIRSAKKRFVELKAESQAFLDSKPYAEAVEPDADGFHQLYKIKLTETLPEEFGLICAHLAEDLRSALDQAGYAAAVAGGVKDPQHAYFPIVRNAADFENNVRGRCKDIPDQVVALFRSLKGHDGGDKLLVALNILCGASKHRLIKPVGVPVGGAFCTNVRSEFTDSTKIFTPHWDTRNNEVVLFRVGPRTRGLQYNATISFYIAFDEVEFVEGEPVLTVLNALTRKVEGIVAATEAECRKLGLIT